MSGVREAGSSWPIARPLTGSRLFLEPLRVDHAAELAAVLDDPALHAFIGGHPEGVAALRARYIRQVAGHSPDGSQGWLNWIMRRRDGRPVGTIQATVSGESDDRVAEIAWMVGTAFQRRGYAREGAEIVLSWLPDQGVSVVRAHIHPAHEASRSVARAVGMSPTETVVEGETRWEVSLPLRTL